MEFFKGSLVSLNTLRWNSTQLSAVCLRAEWRAGYNLVLTLFWEVLCTMPAQHEMAKNQSKVVMSSNKQTNKQKVRLGCSYCVVSAIAGSRNNSTQHFQSCASVSWVWSCCFFYSSQKLLSAIHRRRIYSMKIAATHLLYIRWNKELIS